MRFVLLIAFLGLPSLLASCRSVGTSSIKADYREESRLETRFLDFGNGLQIRIGVQKPQEGPIKADVLFLHGFADRIDNHGPLFEEWNRQGLRVIAFDFPSHGESQGPKLDTFHLSGGAFPGLATIAKRVEMETREDKQRPLLLSGWSTGGLLGVRLLQNLSGISLERKPKAALFLAPGVAVRPLVGKAGIVTQDTLTRNPNPPHKGPIKPLSPLKFPLFATDFLLNVKLSWTDAYPLDLPTYIIVGEESEDHYVSPQKIQEWVQQLRQKGGNAQGLYCPNAMHELDNEPNPIGSDVRLISGQFLGSLGESRPSQGVTCKVF